MARMSAQATDDLLYGVPAIAVQLKVRPRQAHHMIDKGGLPTFRIAGKVCARVSAIDARLAEQQRRASAPSRRERPQRRDQPISINARNPRSARL